MEIRSFVVVLWIGLAGLDTALAQSSSSADSLLLVRADSALAERLYGPAISLYRSYLDRHPQSFHARYGIARGFLYQGEPDRAFPFLDDLAVEFPNEPDPRVARGYAYLHVGRIDPAIEDFLWVTERFPDYSDAWSGLGLSYERSGDLRRASDVYDRWIEAEPENAEAYVARARVHVALGRDQAAERELEAARRLGAPTSDIRPLQDRIDTSDWRDEFGAAAGYEFESFGGRRETWESYRADLSYRVEDRGSVVVEYQRATRHGLWDESVRGDIYAELWAQAYVHTYWQQGLDRRFLPTHDVYVELFQGMRDGWVPSIFFRQMSFSNVRADFYGVGIEKYVGSWLIRARFSLVDVRNRKNPTLQGQLRYYIASPDTYVAVSGGYGREVVSLDAIGSIESISSGGIAVSYQTFVWEHLGFGAAATYAATEILPHRAGFSFRVVSRF